MYTSSQGRSTFRMSLKIILNVRNKSDFINVISQEGDIFLGLGGGGGGGGSQVILLLNKIF